MDAEITENTGLTITEFNNTVKMLKSVEEDFNVGYAAAKNLKLEPVIYKLMAKELSLDKRRRFCTLLKEDNIIDIYPYKKLTFKDLHKEVLASKNDILKVIFQGMVNKSIQDSYLDFEENSYIEYINVKIKW